MPDIKEIVKEKYGKAALRVVTGESDRSAGFGSCCSSVPGAVDPVTVNLYDQRQTEGLPVEAVLASLGCGNPTALAQLNPGEVVLDTRLMRAGFEEPSIEPTRVYKIEDAREFLSGHGLDVNAIAPLVDGRFFSGFIRARKPVALDRAGILKDRHDES